jgi:hypothetical protein
MKELRIMNWMSGFARKDLKGFGRWLLATIVLAIVIGRMHMQVTGNTVYVSGGTPDMMIYWIGFGLYDIIFNPLTNRPQFMRGLPYTSKQEVRMAVGLCFGCFILLILLFMFVPLAISYIPNTTMDTLWNIHDPIKFFIFSFAYYLFITALLLPLTMIYDKKKWYITFAGIAVIIVAISLFFINLMPGDGFRTSARVFDNVEKLPSCNLVIAAMMVVAVATMIASYHIAQKLHAPKRY